MRKPTFVLAIGVGLMLAACNAPAPESVLILTGDVPPGQVGDALDALGAALTSKRLSDTTIVRTDFAKRRACTIIDLETEWEFDDSKWDAPESYRIAVTHDGASRRVVVSSSDLAGLIRGVYELAKQVSAAAKDGAAAWESVRDTQGASAQHPPAS